MSLNPSTSLRTYSFKEESLGKDFAKDKLVEFKNKIDEGQSFTVISMPGVGVSYFLKYLAMQDFARFFHIDLYSLPTLTHQELYKLILTELGGKPAKKPEEQLLTEIKKLLEQLSQKGEKIVLIFSRFDQLRKAFYNQFLSNIQSLTTISENKIVLIFTSILPINQICNEPLDGGNINFYSEILYFKPYSENDLRKLLSIEPPRPTDKDVLDNLIKLSGGHFQLLQILRRSQKPQNLSTDQFVKLQMKGLVDYLDYTQRKTLQKMTSFASHPERAKRVEGSIDDYLLGVGLIKKNGDKYEIFTPLLTEYIKTNLPVKLPVNEAKLFKLLRKNIGNVVSKDEIFNAVWPESEAGATDWALDALIYRLRKHPFMQSNGYIIESQKKVGYTLVQI